VVVLAGLVLVAGGVVAGALLLPEGLPGVVVPTTAPAVSVSVSGEVFDGAHQVAVTPLTTPAVVLRSNDSGVVTASKCAVGGRVKSGGVLWSVNGRPVVALATAVPLWRDLVAGDKGKDVTALQKEVTRLGQKVSATGTYDSDTRTAVGKIVKAAGGTWPADGTLALAGVVWLPSPELVVGSCALRVGDPVAMGQEVAQGAGGLVSLTLATDPGEGWVVKYRDLSAPVVAGAVKDAAFLAGFAAGPEYQFYSSTGSGALQVSVLLATPRQVVVVPPSAVVVKGDGLGCVVSDGKVVPVEIVSSSLGQTMVAPTDGSTPSSVVVHPDAGVAC